MVKRSVGITAVGYGLSLIYGLGLFVNLVAFVISFFDPTAVLSSPLFSSRFRIITEFQKSAIVVWILFFPQFVGLLAIVSLKEWGRKILIVMNAVLCLYFLQRMIFELKSFDSRSFVSFLIYASIVLFFNWPGVKKQFKEYRSSLKRILIIDFDKEFLKTMRHHLQSKGFGIFIAESGERGLSLAVKYKPDLVILETLLPGIKGREVCARLKKNSVTQNIPVIFATAKNSPDDILAERQAGAIAHITKPTDFEQVLWEINKIFGI